MVATRTLLSWAIFAAAAYFLAASVYVENGAPNADEGFYAYASHAVMRGRLPYSDFAYTQTPLLPYLQGAIMQFVGFGVRQQRWIDVSLGALAVGLATALWLRAGLRPALCALLAAVWCLCKALLYFDAIGKTYSMAQLLLVAAACLSGPALRPVRSLILLSILCTAALGCRLTVAPSLVVLWGCFAAANHRSVPTSLLLSIPALTVLMILGPFYLADPGNAFFWTWDYHTKNAEFKDHLGTLLLSFSMVPAITALAVAGVAACAWPGPRARTAAARHGLWLIAAGLLGWATSAFLSGVFPDYAIPCMPLVILGFGLLLSDRERSPVLRLASGPAAGCLLLLLAVLGDVLGKSYFARGYLAAVDEGAAFMRASTAPSDLVLTSTPEIALQSGRPLYPRLELGKFGVTAEMDRGTALRRHILNYGELLAAIEGRSARMVVLYRRDDQWNFFWSVPSMRVFSHESRSLFIDAMSRNYSFVHENDSFLFFEAIPGMGGRGP